MLGEEIKMWTKTQKNDYEEENTDSDGSQKENTNSNDD